MPPFHRRGETDFAVRPDTVSGTADGYLVYAFATKPLTGQAGDGAGLPAGMHFWAQQPGDCTPPGRT
ncbi:hypothetical protein [Streptomyces sp. NBC_00503]|uniref:hypothetical protein n=1 Tax=Streptomyces sp. NBC_00503 TaxID=2903659 RepID=UPI002E811B2F|nr:hypothetical protein [Streptomyces sp. NBC_00503]WUD80810.1 hypothetical protein OG490_09765 [Streptomyces sp. NBC_00503]